MSPLLWIGKGDITPFFFFGGSEGNYNSFTHTHITHIHLGQTQCLEHGTEREQSGSKNARPALSPDFTTSLSLQLSQKMLEKLFGLSFSLWALVEADRWKPRIGPDVMDGRDANTIVGEKVWLLSWELCLAKGCLLPPPAETGFFIVDVTIVPVAYSSDSGLNNFLYPFMAPEPG